MIDLLPSRAVFIDLFGWQIHWYGLLYLAAFAIAWFLLPKLQSLRSLNLSKDEWSQLLTASVIGVIVGGRLGFVLFYEPAYFLSHPFHIFAVWQGGMASHGGFIGVTIALMWSLRDKKNLILPIADVVVVPVALGLACGRIGNFINQELYGTITTLPWGINIPGEEGLRHPTQLYAVIKDLFIATVCYLHLLKTSVPGRTLALFLMLYGALRFIMEFFREQQGQFVEIGPLAFSDGQILTVPLFVAGLILWLRAPQSAKLTK